MILGIACILMAIPTFVDGLAVRGIFLGVYTSLGFVLIYVISSGLGISRPAKLVTWLGIFTFGIGLIPIFSAVYNGAIVILLIFYFKREYKIDLKEKEEREKAKKNKKPEPTVFETFGKEFDYDDDDIYEAKLRKERKREQEEEEYED